MPTFPSQRERLEGNIITCLAHLRDARRDGRADTISALARRLDWLLDRWGKT